MPGKYRCKLDHIPHKLASLILPVKVLKTMSRKCIINILSAKCSTIFNNINWKSIFFFTQSSGCFEVPTSFVRKITFFSHPSWASWQFPDLWNINPDLLSILGILPLPLRCTFCMFSAKCHFIQPWIASETSTFLSLAPLLFCIMLFLIIKSITTSGGFEMQCLHSSRYVASWILSDPSPMPSAHKRWRCLIILKCL